MNERPPKGTSPKEIIEKNMCRLQEEGERPPRHRVVPSPPPPSPPLGTRLFQIFDCTNLTMRSAMFNV